jgi:hypothetical protein
MHVNLLPATFVWRRRMRKRLRQWGCVYGAFGGLVLAWNVQLIGKWWNGLHELQKIHAATEPIRQLQSDRIRLATQSFALQQKINQLQAAVSKDRTTSFLGVVAAGVGSTAKTVQIQEMQVSVTAKSNDSTPPAGEPLRGANAKPIAPIENRFLGNQYMLTLRGIAIESESITEFMESLQESRLFPKIELRSTQERIVLERPVQEFQMECFGYDQ